MKHRCISNQVRMWGCNVPRKTDKILLFNLKNLCDDGQGPWFHGNNPAHRAYMRLIQAEAKRRGLDHTSVTGLR